MASSSAPTSDASSNPSRYSSTRARSSSGLSIRLALGLGERGLDLLGELRQLGQHLDRRLWIARAFEASALLLEPLHQLLGALERVLGAHFAAASRAIRPRIPLTSLPASSEAYRFASRTASSIATSGGTSPRSSS